MPVQHESWHIGFLSARRIQPHIQLCAPRPLNLGLMNKLVHWLCVGFVLQNMPPFCVCLPPPSAAFEGDEVRVAGP